MQRLNLLFDNQIFTIQKFGGISRYFIELFKEFDNNTDIHWGLEGVFSINFYLEKHFKHLDKIQVSHWNFKSNIQLIALLNKFSYFFPLYKKKLENDLYHFTYYDAFYFNKIGNKVPRVVTVYDMIEEIFDGDASIIFSKKHIITNADLVLAISNSTANDIKKYYNIAANKIVVTHLASSLQPINDWKGIKMMLPGRYILFVGLRGWYKNFNGFIESIYPLLNNDIELQVICAGGPEFTKEELAILIRYNINKQVIWKPIGGDDQLAWYYQNALFFAFPSKYEGFGIPILEAMNCNCPVVLSNTSSLREIAGDAGHYFDPESKSSIYNACKEVLDSYELRNDLINKGKIRRESFSWKKTAQATILAYQKILNV